jgi:hypothetical protein
MEPNDISEKFIMPWSWHWFNVISASCIMEASERMSFDEGGHSLGIASCVLLGEGKTSSSLHSVVLNSAVVHVEVALDPLPHMIRQTERERERDVKDQLLPRKRGEMGFWAGSQFGFW